jgi:quinol monooxygenase YgiN
MIINFAKFTIVEGKLDQAVAAAQVLSEKSLGDEGCHEYTIAKNVESESALYVVERWDSMECLGAHMQTQHIADFDAAAADFLAAPPAVTTVTTEL